MSDNQFKLQINFTKAYKDADGNAFLEGIASGPEVDLTDQRMSPEALKSMVASIQKRLIEFRDAHKQEWNDDLGEIVELSLTADNHLFYKSKLDLNLSGAQDLWYRVTTLGKKYGVSIGGAVLKAGMEYVADLGREVFTYFDVDLYEISITRQAAYQYSFANAVTKSLPTKKEEPMSKSDTVAKTDELEHQEAEEQSQDTNLTESVAAEQSDATEEAQQDTQTQSEGEEAPAENPEDAAAEADAKTEASEEAESAEEEVEKSTDATEEQSEDAAGDDPTEVAKAAVLGSWAEADVAYEAVNSLSWNLEWFLWDVVIDADKAKEEKDGLIAAALTEFSRIVQSVTAALIESGVDDEMAKSAEAERTQTPEALSKSLTETTTKADELQKSLDAKTAELDTASQALEETKKSLGEKETELEKRNARKAIVFGKFDGVELAKANPHNDQESKTLRRWINS